MATIPDYRSLADAIDESAIYTYWLRMLDINVTPLSDCQIAQVAAEAIRGNQRIVIANHNLHSVYLSLRDPEMRSFYESASYVHIDGMALIVLANALGVRLKRTHRATSLDFMPHLLPIMARERRRLFYLGGRPGVAEIGANKLRGLYPRLQIRTHHGYLNPAELPDLIQQLNDYQPNVLMVGMGMPVQEKWIQHYRSALNANVIFPVGAYMDYQANIIPTPPRWLAAACLEWMYRLIAEPRRLWYRYMVEPWWVLAGSLRYSLRHPGTLTEVSAARSLQEVMKGDSVPREGEVLAVIAEYEEPVEL